jgi:hypothetical protein
MIGNAIYGKKGRLLFGSCFEDILIIDTDKYFIHLFQKPTADLKIIGTQIEICKLDFQ